MIVYGFYALFAPRLPHVHWGGHIANAGAGFFGGLIGGVAGLSGIAPAIWTQLRGWSKEAARGVYQPFILFTHLLTMLLIGAVALDPRASCCFSLRSRRSCWARGPGGKSTAG